MLRPTKGDLEITENTLRTIANHYSHKEDLLSPYNVIEIEYCLDILKEYKKERK